jgi:dTDP-4-dehydrorhamnose reductase
MRVIVTGAGGLVGSAIAEHFAATPLTHADLDITDAAAVRRVVGKLRPELIFNCAVLGVDQCEQDPDAAHAINVDGPAALAEAAEKCGAALVHFSSNYVFDGRERHVYTTEDPPNPVNVYGRTKLTGECAVFFRCSRAFVVRSSWIFGHGKQSSFVSTVAERLRAGARVQAVSDVWASVTYVDDLVEGVVDLIENGKYGLFHLVNEGVVSYESFGQEAARLIGADERLIEPVHSRDVHKARRPRYTPMLSSIPLRDWREALASFVAPPGRR